MIDIRALQTIFNSHFQAQAGLASPIPESPADYTRDVCPLWPLRTKSSLRRSTQNAEYKVWYPGLEEKVPEFLKIIQVEEVRQREEKRCKGFSIAEGY